MRYDFVLCGAAGSGSESLQHYDFSPSLGPCPLSHVSELLLLLLPSACTGVPGCSRRAGRSRQQA